MNGILAFGQFVIELNYDVYTHMYVDEGIAWMACSLLHKTETCIHLWFVVCFCICRLFMTCGLLYFSVGKQGNTRAVDSGEIWETGVCERIKAAVPEWTTGRVLVETWKGRQTFPASPVYSRRNRKHTAVLRQGRCEFYCGYFFNFLSDLSFYIDFFKISWLQPWACCADNRKCQNRIWHWLIVALGIIAMQL